MNYPTPYILEILEKAITKEIPVLSLLTPDDIAYLNPTFHKKGDYRDKSPMGQARQNVIFETGMAFAKNPDKVILVMVGNVRKFTDISGIHYVKLNDTKEKRRELKDTLASIGCPINDKEEFKEAGDFSIDENITKNIPKSDISKISRGLSDVERLKNYIMDMAKLVFDHKCRLPSDELYTVDFSPNHRKNKREEIRQGFEYIQKFDNEIAKDLGVEIRLLNVIIREKIKISTEGIFKCPEEVLIHNSKILEEISELLDT